MDLVDSFARLGLALAIGFLIGVERGWRERTGAAGSRTAGVRTFALSGLLGGGRGHAGLRARCLCRPRPDRRRCGRRRADGGAAGLAA